MSRPQTTRRAVLGAMGLAGSIAIGGAAQAVTLAPLPQRAGVDRRAWNHAFTIWRAADAALQRAQGVRDAAWEAHIRDRPSEETIPFERLPWCHPARLPRITDLDKLEMRILQMGPTLESVRPQLSAIREIREYRRLNNLSWTRHRVAHFEEQVAVAWDATSAASDALQALPAPDAVALRWKLDNLFPLDRDEEEETDGHPLRTINVLRADIMRMVGGAA